MTWGSLARPDRHGQSIGRRRKRADPAVVVGAGGVIREVEIEHEALADAAKVGSLDTVEEVASGGIALGFARRVGEGQEDATSISVEPVQIECVRYTPELEARRAQALEHDRFPTARTDRYRLGLALDNLCEGAVLRVVGEVVETLEVLAGARRKRRLRMRAKELVANLPPPSPRRLWNRALANLLVEREDPSLPVEQRQHFSDAGDRLKLRLRLHALRTCRSMAEHLRTRGRRVVPYAI